MGGWVVSTSRAEKHRGFIAVRVPADRLDEVVGRLRGIAAEVVSEVSSSRDVTDEYVDLTSRLGNLNAAEAALLRLFDRAQTVEEALDVRRTLTDVQGEIEVLKGPHSVPRADLGVLARERDPECWSRRTWRWTPGASR